MRLTIKCHNHRPQTNLRHREEETLEHRRGPGRGFRDTEILARKHKGIRDLFVNFKRDTGYFDHFLVYWDCFLNFGNICHILGGRGDKGYFSK